MIDRKRFFEKVRASLFAGKLGQGQVSGMSAILDEWETGKWGDNEHKLAYMLATVFHECAKEMQPIIERGKATYFNKYGHLTTTGKRLGNTQSGDGYNYRGRGFVQITGRANYQKASDKLSVDLIGRPEMALELPVATQILFSGMTDGWFTGKRLGDYFDGGKTDYVNARRIINGLDQSKTIAVYAKRFYEALN